MEKSPNMSTVEKRKIGPGRATGQDLLDKARSLGIGEDDPAFKAVESTVALGKEQDVLAKADERVEEESGDVASVQKLLGEEESNLRRLQKAIDTGELDKIKKVGRTQREVITKVPMSKAMTESTNLEIARLKESIEEQKNQLVREQEQLKRAEDYRSEVQQNVSNLQTSVQQNNNSFQASKDSGDNFFMGSLFKPMMEGFGASSQ